MPYKRAIKITGSSFLDGCSTIAINNDKRYILLEGLALVTVYGRDTLQEWNYYEKRYPFSSLLDPISFYFNLPVINSFSIWPANASRKLYLLRLWDTRPPLPWQTRHAWRDVSSSFFSSSFSSSIFHRDDGWQNDGDSMQLETNHDYLPSTFFFFFFFFRRRISFRGIAGRKVSERSL